MDEGAIPENLMTDFPVDKGAWFEVVAGEEPEEGIELEVVALPPGEELP